MLRNPTFVVQSRTFEQLSLQKATFDCFLTNFRAPLILRITGMLFGKSRTTCGKPEAGSQGTAENCAT